MLLPTRTRSSYESIQFPRIRPQSVRPLRVWCFVITLANQHNERIPMDGMDRRRFASFMNFTLDFNAFVLIPNSLERPDGWLRSFSSFETLRILGPRLTPYIPELTRIATSGSGDAPSLAAEVLIAAGPEAWPQVLSLATNGNFPGSQSALRSIGQLGDAALPAIPTLIRQLKGVDCSPRGKQHTAWATCGSSRSCAFPRCGRRWVRDPRSFNGVRHPRSGSSVPPPNRPCQSSNDCR